MNQPHTGYSHIKDSCTIQNILIWAFINIYAKRSVEQPISIGMSLFLQNLDNMFANLVSICIHLYQSVSSKTCIRLYQCVSSNLYPWTKVEKSMLSTEPERQSGSRTEHRQRIFQKNFTSLFRASFSRKLIMSSHLGSDSSVFINFYETFAVFPPWVTG